MPMYIIHTDVLPTPMKHSSSTDKDALRRKLNKYSTCLADLIIVAFPCHTGAYVNRPTARFPYSKDYAAQHYNGRTATWNIPKQPSSMARYIEEHLG